MLYRKNGGESSKKLVIYLLENLQVARVTDTIIRQALQSPMITCPRCQQKVDSQALQCPYCSNILKAYGHPGMTLHQAVVKGEFLCQTCLYHADDSCTFPQRPHATSCTLYKNSQIIEEKIPPLPFSRILKNWCLRNKGLLLLLTVILGSVVIAFINSRR